MPSKPPPPVESYTHKSETRSNLPTEQTSRYMGAEDRRPVPYKPPVRSRAGPVLSWDRDESLDAIETPATPLYIHEKIHPASFAESLQDRAGPQTSLFGDFNNLPEDATYDWYKHRGNWQNRIVRGETRHVMASLLEKEAMGGQVQMVYFDPPYGISFKSNMRTSARSRKVGAAAKDIPNDSGIIKAFRDTYKNGIHSYLDNVFRVAIHARELLRDSGSFFLQIGPENVHRLAVVLDEVFGQQNHVATIPFAKSGGTSSRTLPEVADYLLWYAKDRAELKYRQLYEPLTRKEKIEHMNWDAMVEFADGTARSLTDKEKEDPDEELPKSARLFRRMPLVSPGESTTGRSKPYKWNGTTYPCPPGDHWRVSNPEGLDRLHELGRLIAASDESGKLTWRRYENEIPGRRIHNLWSKQMSPSDMHYVVETAESVIERCILMSTDPGDLVLDPTCGSGTTAYVAEKWGRRWVTTDCSAVSVSLARQRLASAVFDYHLLKDSREGAQKEATLLGSSGSFDANRSYNDDPEKGFVYDRVPTVSAGILAYDQDVPPTLLVNRPFKKRATVRVSSPFTVESHSPYRVIDPDTVLAFDDTPDSDNMMRAIIDALGTSGIKDSEHRIKIEEIEDYPSGSGGLITHLGQTEQGKAAIFVAPEDCTVSSQMVNLAAEQAATMPSVRVLIAVAFAFEPDTRSRTTEARGRLTIHKAQANQDLRIGNLSDDKQDVAFVRIGEPEITVEPAGDDEVVVEVLGYETYDPATGQLRSGKAGDIHCWMIDTDYDGLSFFARRIHFPGGKDDRQIKNFRKRLGRRVDPSLWGSMLSHRSAPFKKPGNGRIAVRIVTNTHRDDGGEGIPVSGRSTTRPPIAA